MKLEVHILTHDDEQMLEWSLRHYRQFAHNICVHDGGPHGKGMDVIKHVLKKPSLGIVSYWPWDTAGQLNDELAMRLKNTCWHGTEADWVAVVDCDELIWFPDGAAPSLAAYERTGAAVIRPNGFEMFSDQWIEPNENSIAQIVDLVKFGAQDDEWYAKPILFSPKRVAESGFGIGAHESDPVLRDGRRLHVGKNWPHPSPPCYLLHFKSIFGGVERIATRYDATRARLAQVNVRNGWGNFSPGMDHALEKRERLLPFVRRVIA